MFFFYHPAQTPKNASYYKGTLFESVLRTYLGALGYRVDLRQKHHSLEYDLEGTAHLDARPLVGEAKAHGRPISGEMLSSFVGKLYPLHARNRQLVGVFLSTSSLTAEAEDFASSLRDTDINLRVLSGDGLLADIAEKLGLPSASTVSEAVRELGVFPLSAHMLLTDQGPYILQIGAAESGATPAAFSVVRRDGRLVEDVAFLADLRKRVPELQELSPAYGGAQRGNGSPSWVRGGIGGGRGEIPEGLILGNEWSDYRLPAPPSFFVGRRGIANRIVRTVLAGTHPGVLQVKSRSGVGKSSLMAFVADALVAAGARVHVYDARNIKSVLDLWAVVQRFTGASAAAADFGDMERQIAAVAGVAGEAGGSHAALLFDQFESTFTDPDLFNAFELLALAIVKARPHVCVLFARKNDLLTTFDESLISLERLNEVSESIVLEDFSAAEAVELIEAIASHAEKPVSPDLRAHVLEFAQGFPWLLKRTMAHVVALLQGGQGQVELISAALRLADLFDEELAELDELERDYLLRIVRQLPATYHQLDRYFDEDPYLPRILDKLTRERLIRLSGSTYDTYNDVFKEYLVYQRLPEFKLSFVYRLGNSGVLKAFRTLLEIRRFTTEEMQRTLRMTRKSVWNLMRELRNLGLLDQDAGVWVIPEAVLDAHGRVRLGEYLRQQLVKNGLVADILHQLQTEGAISRDDLGPFLQARFPFVEASATTWRFYATNLLGWLQLVRLVQVSDDVVSLSKDDRAEVAQRIGNLRYRARLAPARGAPELFVPGAWWRRVEETFARLADGVSVADLSHKEGDALRDLARIGVASSDGRLKTATLADATNRIASFLREEPYRSYWEALEGGEDPADAATRIFQLGPVSRATAVWRAKLLHSWGTGTGILAVRMRIPSKRGGRGGDGGDVPTSDGAPTPGRARAAT